jgi:hypothetical protein
MTTAAPTRPLEHYCMVCRYAVNRHREAGVPDRFEHTASYENWDGPDHQPLPVPLAELTDVHMVCDICSHPNPIYAYRFTPVTTGLIRTAPDTFTRFDMGEWWVICKPCSVPIERRDIAGMVEQARRPFRARGEPTTGIGGRLGPIYRQLLAKPYERIGLREVRW